jgi:hypothetical protein
MAKRPTSGTGLVWGIVAVVVVWAYSRSGALVAGLLCLLIVAGYLIKRLLARRKAHRQFNEAAAMILHQRMPYATLLKVMEAASKPGIFHADLIGRLKQFRESIDLALSSKDREVAESRMEFAIETATYLRINGPILLNASVIDDMNVIAAHAIETFPTAMVLNHANGHLKKAEKMKTDKGQLKHLGLAADVLAAGVVAGRGDVGMLSAALTAVQDQISGLASRDASNTAAPAGGDH